MTTDYVRKQIILEKEQSDELSKIAKNEGLTFSELVRNYLNAQIRAQKYRQMERAAEHMAREYSADPYLTEMTALDGQDVIDGQG